MGRGFRIRHRTAASQMVVIPFLDTPLDQPHDCLTCGTQHPVKTYHLNLDSQGTCIVSRVVYEKLVHSAGQEFVYEGPIEDPPAQGIGFDGKGNPQVIRERPIIHMDYNPG